MTPVFNACNKASSFTYNQKLSSAPSFFGCSDIQLTRPPRAVLTKIALGFISANSAVDIMLAVLAPRGQWRETTSDFCRSSLKDDTRV